MPSTVGVAHDPRQSCELGGEKSSSGRTNDVSPTDPCAGRVNPYRSGVALTYCRTCARRSFITDPARQLAPAIEHDGERWVCPNRIEVSA